MKRAKFWDPEVEDAHRLQNAGWRDLTEYTDQHGEPERWEETGFIMTLRVKKNGFFTYWKEQRECEDKHVPKIKLYYYE